MLYEPMALVSLTSRGWLITINGEYFILTNHSSRPSFSPLPSFSFRISTSTVSRLCEFFTSYLQKSPTFGPHVFPWIFLNFPTIPGLPTYSSQSGEIPIQTHQPYDEGSGPPYAFCRYLPYSGPPKAVTIWYTTPPLTLASKWEGTVVQSFFDHLVKVQQYCQSNLPF